MDFSVVPVRERWIAEWYGLHLREEDEVELRAATGNDPVAALGLSFDLSHECHSVEIEAPKVSFPMAIFGVVGQDNGAPGVIWMLCTNTVSLAPKAVLRKAEEIIPPLATRFDGLQCLAMASNYLHVRWCQHLGFVELGRRQINGHEFIHLYRTP